MHDGGSIRTAFCHAIDITPTVLDVTGIELPEEFQGVGQVPLHGDSLAPGWEDAEVRIRSGSQYFEQLGHRGVWKDGWKAVTYHFKGTPFDQDQWALYNLEEDFSECHDLSGELPEKLEELVQTWWAEAEKYGVLPLDDRTLELLGGVRRPETPHNRREYVYYPPVSHVPADAAPPLGGRSWSVTCDVEVNGDCEGILYTRGSHNVGHAFFIKDRKLQFVYNALGRHYRATGELDLSDGTHEVGVAFEREGRSGRLVLTVDGRQIGSTMVGTIVRTPGSTGIDVGRNGLSPVVDDYEPPFAFTGQLEKIVVDVSGELLEDKDAQMRAVMAHQ